MAFSGGYIPESWSALTPQSGPTRRVASKFPPALAISISIITLLISHTIVYLSSSSNRNQTDY